jgi:hypothetical protein
MDIKEIQQRSEQIALMLGYVNTTPDDRDFNIYENKLKPFSAIPKTIETMSMLFYSDWNWLMEAVDFIESKIIYTVKIISTPTISQRWYMYTVQIYNTRSATLLNQGEKIIEIQSNYHKNQSKKETIFIAVSDFAKVYNEKLAD